MKTNINISNCFSWSRTNQVMNHGRELVLATILDPKQYTGSPGIS
jgi:hypothetical protein